MDDRVLEEIYVRVQRQRYEYLLDCESRFAILTKYIERERFLDEDMIRLILGMQPKVKADENPN